MLSLKKLIQIQYGGRKFDDMTKRSMSNYTQPSFSPKLIDKNCRKSRGGGI